MEEFGEIGEIRFDHILKVDKIDPSEYNCYLLLLLNFRTQNNKRKIN